MTNSANTITIEDQIRTIDKVLKVNISCKLLEKVFLL